MLKHATLCHIWPAEVVEDVTIVIKDDRILSVAPDGVSTEYADAQVINLQGKIVMPGLVCSHNHFYSGLARGILADVPRSTDFVSNLMHLWWRLDRAIDSESLYSSGLICAIEAIRCGCTSVIDHHASPNFIGGSLDVLKRCFSEVGLRGIECYETTDRNGETDLVAGIEENRRFAESVRDVPLMEAMIGGHAPFTLPDRGLKALGDVVQDTGKGFHIHVAEDQFDPSFSHRYHGIDLLRRLDDFALLSEKTLIAHGLYLTEADLSLLNKRGCFLAHNCRSNMNNGVGYQNRLDRIESVALGTDGIGSDMLQETRFAYFKHRETKGPLPPESFVHFLWNGNQILERVFLGRFGRIEPGYQADLVVLDYRRPTPLVSQNVAGHVLFGMSSSDVETVIVNGRLVMEDRQFRIDLDPIYSDARKAAEKIWSRMDL